jgi:hypothetical protein
MTPISGLHHPMVIGKHHNCERVWLTGANVPGDGGAFRNTVSADQLMAEVQGNATRFSSLEMAVEGTSLSWSKDGIQIPAERNTQQIFNVLFGVEKDSKETIRRRLSRRGSILDIVADDAKRVNNKLGSEDRSKLDEYLTAVRQVEERTRRADEWLNVPKPLVSAAEAASLQRKLSMAEAGYPLRRETFYLSHRLGGPQMVPFDTEALVARLLPEVAQGQAEGLRVVAQLGVLRQPLHLHGPALRVVVEQERVPAYKFITSSCAIIGGVFTVIGLLENVIHHTASAITKKTI